MAPRQPTPGTVAEADLRLTMTVSALSDGWVRVNAEATNDANERAKAIPAKTEASEFGCPASRPDPQLTVNVM